VKKFVFVEFDLDGNSASPNVRPVNIDEKRSASPAEIQKPIPIGHGKTKPTWFALYGFLFVSIALFAYVTNVLLGPLRLLFLNPPLFLRINELVIWLVAFRSSSEPRSSVGICSATSRAFAMQNLSATIRRTTNF